MIGNARLEVVLHLLFEVLAYAVAFALFRRRRRAVGDPLRADLRLDVMVAAVVGAALGSKLLHLLARPHDLAAHWREFSHYSNGKTIVGALLGGLLLVEWSKRRRGIRIATGDLYAFPLAVGIAIGRIGCFLAGVRDDTVGMKAPAPFGIDQGDGMPRLPTALYELVYCAGLAVLLARRSRRPHGDGDLFAFFMIAYLAFRLLVDFTKPYETVLGLGVIQWACLAGLAHYARRALKQRRSAVP